MSDRSGVVIFELRTLADYLTLCGEFVEDHLAAHHDLKRAFPAILSLNHIPDWLKEKLSSDEREALGLDARVGTPVKNHYEGRNADLVVLRDLANGLKHLAPRHSTQKIEGYGMGPFGVGPYGVPYLLVDRGEAVDTARRYTSSSKLCADILEWWRAELAPAFQNDDVAVVGEGPA